MTVNSTFLQLSHETFLTVEEWEDMKAPRGLGIYPMALFLKNIYFKILVLGGNHSNYCENILDFNMKVSVFQIFE